MLNELVLGALLISLTVIVHAVIQEQLIIFLEWFAPYLGRWFGRLWKVQVTVIAVLGMLLALIIDMWIWALFFLFVTQEPNIQNYESALYFSVSTFTTLGYGDIVLSPNWRLMASFEATNGLLMFGWATAFLFEIIMNVYRHEKISGRLSPR